MTSQSSDKDGVWVGIDLGTTNSACAIWDSTRGSPKWIRMADICPMESSKWGRMVPSLVQVQRDSNENLPPSLVGAQTSTSDTQGSSTVSLISSIKRLLGRRLVDLDPHWVSSLPFDLTEDEEGNLQLLVTTLEPGATTTTVTPVEVLAVILRAIRLGAQSYLQKYAAKKYLDVPGGATATDNYVVRHAVIGVPAHFSKRHIALLEQAGHLAGLDGEISTCLESTAAAMAYGLSFQSISDKSNIMVIDMGGGTTDITIATKQNNSPVEQDDEQDELHDKSRSSSSSSYQVLVTMGEEQLGGDDIDQAMVDYCLSQATSQDPTDNAQLLRACRKAKERLCHLEEPSKAETIYVSKQDKVEIAQPQFEALLQPWLDKANDLIQRALDEFQQHVSASISSDIAEVILVGGTTRVPAIRRMIQNRFPPGLELCTSLNPMSSVAQGLAIQAALVSKLVPPHQLYSALMLDCLPHAIGVRTDDKGGFIETIPRNSPLPARGSATFVLADKYQAGVTVPVIEHVGNDENGNPLLEPIAQEPFTFLLRRLSAEEYKSLASRTIEVGMKVTRDGQFIVSVFDELDPEQVRKKERFQRRQVDDTFGELGFAADMLMAESGFSSEQILLLGALIGVIILYIVVKVAFNEIGEAVEQVVQTED